MIEHILLPQTVEALGWTLIHSIWQGAAFAILLVFILIALRKYTAQSRYIVSVGLLCAFFLTVTATFWQQWQESKILFELVVDNSNSENLAGIVLSDNGVGNITSTEVNLNNNLSLNNENSVSEESNWVVIFTDYFNQHLPLLVTIWLMGILFLQLRFLGQLAYVQRLKHYGTKLFPAAWKGKIDELEGKLRIQKKVKYLTSMRIESPMVIGWLKPVVLLPQQLLNSLTETEIYAVLAHELAHIRREDFVINLVQTFLCNVFFFHPGVWWMSNRIDDEREHCCDDLAIEATGHATSYAKTLINVSELQLAIQRNPALAVALSGKNTGRSRGGFSARIKRLFISNNSASTFREGFATACILVFALFLGVAASGGTSHTSGANLSQLDEVQILESEEETNTEPIGQTKSSTTKTTTQNETFSNIKESDELTQVPFENLDVAETRIDALVMACGEGDFDFVKTLLNSGIDINGIGSEGFSPLMMATNNEESEIVAFLLDQGAEVNKTYGGRTALIEAADEGSIESMKQLLIAGAEVNYYWTQESPTAISMAASEDKLDCLKLLLEYGADIDGIGKSIPPLHIAAEENRLDIIDYLISQKVNINKKDAVGRTALMYAASEGNSLVVKRLIETGADFSEMDMNGHTAWDYAEEEDHFNILKYLGDSKNDSGRANSDRYDKKPPIHQATSDGYIEKVQRMVEQGSDVNARDDYGRTPLHISSGLGHNIDMEVLIDLGADVNAQDDQGRTPLMYAAADGKEGAAVLLVSRLADVNIPDVDGMTAYDWSITGGNEGLAKFLGLITTNKKWRNENGVNSKNLDKRDKLRQTEEKHDQKRIQKIEEDRVKKEMRLQKIEEKKQLRLIQNNIENEFVVEDYDDIHIKIHTDIHTNTHTDFHINTNKDSVTNSRTDLNTNDQSEIEKKETLHRTEKGYHLRQYDLKEEIPLLLEAISNASIERVARLVTKSNVNVADDTGQTALMVAARKNRLDIAKLLIGKGADVNHASTSGLTALHYAALEDHDQMAQFLLNNKAEVDVTMHYSSTDGNFSNEPLVWEYIGATPLLIAIESSNTKVLSVLLDAGANPYHVLIRNEYKLNKNREKYLSGGEVMGINVDFLKQAKLIKSNGLWTPYEQALLINDSAILSKFLNKR